VLLLASLIFFLLNIILKANLSLEDYGNYALLLTFISIASSLGLLSLEQLILRFSILKNDQYFYINKKILISFCISTVLFIVIFSIIGRHYFSISSFLLMFLALGSILLMLLYNIYRLIKRYVYAQIIYNSWKFVLFICIVYLINSQVSFLQIVNILVITFIILTLFFSIIFLYTYKIKVYENQKEEIILMQLSFFISMLIMTTLGYGDRFIIEYYLNVEELGKYFYYITVVLFPYILFQSYFGFKELPQFRENFSSEILKTKVLKAIIFGFLLSLLIGVFLFCFNSLNLQFIEKLKIENYNLILILMLTGIIKITYSILSAAVGATSNNKIIKKLNFYSIIAIIVIVFIFFIINIKSIESIAILYLIIWLFRSFLYYNQGLRNVY